MDISLKFNKDFERTLRTLIDEFGEDFENCIIREVKEEINCKIKGLEQGRSGSCLRTWPPTTM